MEPISLPFRATEAQTPGILSSAENALYGGARGGGKSASLAGDAVTYAFSNPGLDIVMMRADLSDFKRTTLLEVRKQLPQRDHFRENLTDSYIKIRSIIPSIESTIWYTEGKDPNSLKSGNIAAIYGDEAEEIPFATATHLAGGLRQAYPREIWDKINPLTGRVFGQFPAYRVRWASNPAPCWLMDVFPVLPGELDLYRAKYAEDKYFDPFPSPYSRSLPPKQIDSDYAFFPFLAKDNPHNPPGYFERLIRMYQHDEVLLGRNVYGRWDASMQGLVYQLRREHRWYTAEVGKRLYVPGEPVVLGIDPSNGAGFYVCMVLQFVADRVFVVDEWSKEAGTDEELADWLHKQPYANDIVDAVHDSALPVTGLRLRQLGIPARPCLRKDIVGQINAVKAVMQVDESKGYAALLIDEARCPRLLQEFGKRIFATSRREDGSATSEIPKRGWDDALKALEYPVMERMPTLMAQNRYRAPERQKGTFSGRKPQDFDPLNRTHDYQSESSEVKKHLGSVGPQYRAPISGRRG